MRLLAMIPAVMLLLSACGPSDPREARIDNIQDASEAQADGIEDAADQDADRLRAEAEALDQQAATTNGFEAARLQSRAHGLREEAEIAARQGEARARAVRDKARAEVSAIRAE
ncbi:hypothetical protein ACMGDH_04760 [Sphingomonas sp. DT-207]|uniref:hypothetical protein n=1 Tax=Sphingomonas sp. DT-207 TaxID=3396167 RepID=UPI003F1C7C92